jgi:hypothetical protein
MKCDCCGKETELRRVMITDNASPQTVTPRNIEGQLCSDCERKLHNPALQDRQFNDWLADAWQKLGCKPWRWKTTTTVRFHSVIALKGW